MHRSAGSSPLALCDIRPSAVGCSAWAQGPALPGPPVEGLVSEAPSLPIAQELPSSMGAEPILCCSWLFVVVFCFHHSTDLYDIEKI